ncbi:MAG: peptidoglycan DD-metalloendopeptidase family protein [Chloroflexota bacterium]|nr:peptidoglycan DD-metalloendopeptidase family protein [Chloroflexota bacterium]
MGGDPATWPRSMSGRLPIPETAEARAAQVPAADPASIDDAFDARAVIRPAGTADAASPKRTYEVTLYRAEAGDSAWKVAQLYGVSTMTIWWANRVEAWERLRVGQLLRVLPISGIEHLVRDGDTLDSIARAYHADADAIAEYNRLNGGVVILGQRIIVPDGRGGRYVAVEGISRSASIPRLQPGQADRAPVDHVAVATPLLAPTPSSPTGVKGTGGVAWPADPDWSAGPVGPVSEPYVPAWDWGPFPGNGSGGSEPPGVSTPLSRPSDGQDDFERLGFVGERPGAAPDQAAGEMPWIGDGASRDDGQRTILMPPDRPELSGQIPAGRRWSRATASRDDGRQTILMPPDRPELSGHMPAGRRWSRATASRDDGRQTILLPVDAPVTSGHGARGLDWPDGGPPPGPKQGNILIIDDERLTLTEAILRRERSLLWPVHGGGRLTQELHAAHSGIDIAHLLGTPLLAAESGRVVFAGYRDDRAGRTIYLKHGPALFTGYGHLWRIDVEAGDWVDRGQVIGYMGSSGYSTGSHVHFTLTAGPLPNYHPHALDPLLYLRRP